MARAQVDELQSAITSALRDGTRPAPGETGLLALTGLEPTHGDAAGGTDVLIRGSGFTAKPRKGRVYFGAREGTVVRFASDDELIVEAPPGTPGDVVDVRVIFEPGDDLTLPKAFTFAASPWISRSKPVTPSPR